MGELGAAGPYLKHIQKGGNWRLSAGETEPDSHGEGAEGVVQACLAGAHLYLPSDLHGVEIAVKAVIVPGSD